MPNANIKQTVFHVEKIRNVVGIGRSSAYQVVITPGKTLGRMGPVSLSTDAYAANHDRFTVKTRLGNWLHRSVAALAF